MSATTVQKSIPTPFVKKKKPKRISWATLEKKYLTREDNWKYKWVGGVVEKTKRVMYTLNGIKK